MSDNKTTIDVEITLDPEKIEAVARMMAHALGRDPDEVVPSSGYSDANMIPYWRMQTEWALRFIAAYQTMQQIEAF